MPRTVSKPNRKPSMVNLDIRIKQYAISKNISISDLINLTLLPVVESNLLNAKMDKALQMKKDAEEQLEQADILTKEVEKDMEESDISQKEKEKKVLEAADFRTFYSKITDFANQKPENRQLANEVYQKLKASGRVTPGYRTIDDVKLQWEEIQKEAEKRREIS